MKPSEIIRERGWCQGVSTDIHGRHCLWGAVQEATQRDIPTADKILAQLREAVGSNPIIWNDRRGRTADEVIAVLESVGL